MACDSTLDAESALAGSAERDGKPRYRMANDGILPAMQRRQAPPPDATASEYRVNVKTCARGDGLLAKCLDAGLGTAQNQGVNVMRTLVGVN